MILQSFEGNFHYFIIYTVSTSNYLFISFNITDIYLESKLAWRDRVLSMQNASGTTDNQTHYSGWDTVFPLFNLSSPNFFFPHFRFVTNSQSPYHSLCIRKPISSCNPCKCWTPLPIPWVFSQENAFCLPDCPPHSQCRPADAHLPKAAWKATETAAHVPLARVSYIIYFAFILRYRYPFISFFLSLCEWGFWCLFLTLFTLSQIILHDTESHG